MATAPQDCPCVVGEAPVSPCTHDSCFHFHADAASCAHCDPTTSAIEAENARLREDNRRLRLLCRDVLPRLRRLLADAT